MKQLVLGILAHVDAGKTTLSEALLYRTGAIRDLGRVDHKNAHLDTHALERARGRGAFPSISPACTCDPLPPSRGAISKGLFS